MQRYRVVMGIDGSGIGFEFSVEELVEVGKAVDIMQALMDVQIEELDKWLDVLLGGRVIIFFSLLHGQVMEEFVCILCLHRWINKQIMCYMY